MHRKNNNKAEHVQGRKGEGVLINNIIIGNIEILAIINKS